MPARASESDRDVTDAGCAEAAFHALLRAYGLVDRLMQRYFARFGISGSQWAVLRTLYRAELAAKGNLHEASHRDRPVALAAQKGTAPSGTKKGGDEQQGLRLTDLSERLLIQPPSVTGVVDRLQRTGLVARDHSATDLRSKRVTLTTEGRTLVQRVLEVHQAQIQQLLAGLSAEQQKELHGLLGTVGRHMEMLLGQGPVSSLPAKKSALPLTKVQER